MSVILGDCLNVMAGMKSDSVDAIVTDPPYDLVSIGKRFGKEGAAPPKDAAFGGRYSRLARGFMGKAWDGSGIAFNPETWAAALRVAKPGAYLLAFGGTRTYHRMTVAIEDAGWIIRDCLVWAYASGFPKSRALLKPAWEPIVMARKLGPLRALAIDACRIGTTKDVPASASRTPNAIYGAGIGSLGTGPTGGGFDPTLGRWPANVLLTDPIFDGDTPGIVGGGWQSGGGNPAYQSPEAGQNSYRGTFQGGPTGKEPVDTEGTYSRFFLIPKADRAEREPAVRDSAHLPERVVSVWGGDEDQGVGAGKKSTIPRRNVHPTVKPLDLMRHLVRLVTPTGGTVLDPFVGSGTTAVAAEMEGFDWIGIEREPEYVAIAEARLDGTQRGLGLESGPVSEGRL